MAILCCVCTRASIRRSKSASFSKSILTNALKQRFLRVASDPIFNKLWRGENAVKNGHLDKIYVFSHGLRSKLSLLKPVFQKISSSQYLEKQQQQLCWQISHFPVCRGRGGDIFFWLWSRWIFIVKKVPGPLGVTPTKALGLTCKVPTPKTRSVCADDNN